MAAMTMPVRPVRVRAGIVEAHLIVTNVVAPCPGFGVDPRANTDLGNRLHGTNVMLAFRYCA
jgi:hypothetical protein